MRQQRQRRNDSRHGIHAGSQHSADNLRHPQRERSVRFQLRRLSWRSGNIQQNRDHSSPAAVGNQQQQGGDGNVLGSLRSRPSSHSSGTQSGHNRSDTDTGTDYGTDTYACTDSRTDNGAVTYSCTDSRTDCGTDTYARTDTGTHSDSRTGI